MALPLFAITLFVSAFLLFLVQPMIGKMILPRLGGTPQVWNTCMMFFQTALLFGYGYTHTISTRLPLKKQLLFHGLLLIVPLFFLLPTPFNIYSWSPDAEENPIPQTLLLLTMIVGVPFFVVSTSAPLLQKWFSSTGHPAAKDPYFLYGASNLGSLLSLVCYPFLIEPYFVIQTQTWIWTVSFVILAGLIVASAMLVWKSPPAVQLGDGPAEPDPAVEPPPPLKETSTAIQPAAAMRGVVRKKGAKLAESAPAAMAETRGEAPRSDVMSWTRRLRWILLAAVPSSLMLGVTSYVSTDLSPFPLLWAFPLALYLITFILVFSKWPVTWTEAPHTVMLFVGPIAIFALCWIIMIRGFSPFGPTIISFLGFFVVALVCHGELAKDRPSPRHLTEYFLLMSVGGMVGGVFNGLFAPVIFTGVAEYPIAIIFACLMRPRMAESGWTDGLLLQASPDLEKWSQDTGDQMSVAFGGKPTRSTYLVNVTFDIILGLIVFGIAYMLSHYAGAWGWRSGNPTKNGIMRFLRFLGFGPQSVAAWYQATFHAVVLGIPLVMALFLCTRPWRFGIAIAGILASNLYFVGADERVVYAGRSYFGVLRVLKDEEYANGHVEEGFVPAKEGGAREAQFHYLMHGTTYHGRNYYDPPALSRLSTTYYHRWGPVGTVMERYNWLPGPQNTFWADNRMPASMVGLGAAALGIGGLPLDQICNVWSEPPIATIGLGSGTMASYGRPLQHVVYYEIDEKIRNFSLPLNSAKQPFFTYLRGSMERGCNLEVIMGDARLSMQNSTPGPKAKRDAEKAERANVEIPAAKERKGSLFTIDADGKIIQDKENFLYPQREKYYKVIVVDAFSSDAIPIHLITTEAIQLYMDQLQDDGVLCVHTSNRHMDLVKPVADIASDLGLAFVVGHDPGSREDRRRGEKTEFASLGHFGSEYIMLSRSKDRKDKEGKIIEGRLNIKSLERIRLDPTKPFNATTNPVVGLDYEKFYGEFRRWYIPNPPDMRRWTDDYSNIISILR